MGFKSEANLGEGLAHYLKYKMRASPEPFIPC